MYVCKSASLSKRRKEVDRLTPDLVLSRTECCRYPNVRVFVCVCVCSKRLQSFISCFSFSSFFSYFSLPELRKGIWVLESYCITNHWKQLMAWNVSLLFLIAYQLWGSLNATSFSFFSLACTFESNFSSSSVSSAIFTYFFLMISTFLTYYIFLVLKWVISQSKFPCPCKTALQMIVTATFFWHNKKKFEQIPSNPTN